GGRRTPIPPWPTDWRPRKRPSALTAALTPSTSSNWPSRPFAPPGPARRHSKGQRQPGSGAGAGWRATAGLEPATFLPIHLACDRPVHVENRSPIRLSYAAISWRGGAGPSPSTAIWLAAAGLEPATSLPTRRRATDQRVSK